MSYWRLVWQGLIFHWRIHFTVFLGTALSTAILVGAVAVGTSVNYSLQEILLSRLGKVDHTLVASGRWFREELSSDIQQVVSDQNIVVPTIQLNGMVTGGSPQKRVNNINVIGVDDRFVQLWSTDEGNGIFMVPRGDNVVVNENLAQQLGITSGESILLYIQNPDVLPGETPLSKNDDRTIAARLTVGNIVNYSEFGDFSQLSSQTPPANIFVPLGWLQEKIDRNSKANTLLFSGDSNWPQVLNDSWQLGDAQLKIRPLEGGNAYELQSDRVIIDSIVQDAALSYEGHALGIYTYLVNNISVGENHVPYSMVSGISNIGSNNSAALPDPLLNTIDPGKVVINEWTASQLQASVNDELTITYFVFDDRGNLVEETARFIIQAIVPIEGLAADSSLMPNFPGLAGADDCVDWDPGIEIDTSRIRDEDEEYWDTYGGAPKVFLSLSDAQRIWANRFGSLTSIRFYPDDFKDNVFDKINTTIRDALKPSDFGFVVVPVKQLAIKSTDEGIDFSGLFIGFSFFLIFAAILLCTLLFMLGIDQRQREIATLRALGWPIKKIRLLIIVETTFVAALAVLLGAVLGQYYTKAMIHGLNTIWSQAVRTNRLEYYLPSHITFIGVCSALILIMCSTVLTLRLQSLQSIRGSLTAGRSWAAENRHVASRLYLFKSCFIVLSICTVGCFVLGLIEVGPPQLIFFAAGILFLGTVYTGIYIILNSLATSAFSKKFTVLQLGLLSTSRKSSRSMVSTGLIGLGTFLVVAVGLNQRNANSDLSMRSSPTGGFEYYGTSTISIIEDLASPDGRDEYGLGEEEFRDIEILSFRTSGGEDASCLNLNRAQRPSILGVKPNELDNLKTFSFHSVVEQVDPNHPWLALSMLKGDNTIPAVVDQSSAQWALGLKLGDTYEFEKENGETINLEIVGLVNQSILQGSILISDENFQSIFPSISGYRAFLIDTPVDDKMQLSSLLERRFEKVGLDLVPTSQRLSEFQSVENTYLSIFLVLGGLGLALGCLSLGIVLLRNILERRAEFSLLAAIGFTKKRIQYLIFIEHCWLLLVGVLLGTVAGIISVWPIVQSRATQLPLFTLCILLIIIMASGLGSVYLSTLAAHRKLDTKVLQSE